MNQKCHLKLPKVLAMRHRHSKRTVRLRRWMTKNHDKDSRRNRRLAPQMAFGLGSGSTMLEWN